MNDTPTPTPTPRTDDLEFNLIEFCDNQIRFPKMSDHARKLELELTAVTEQRDRLAEAVKHYLPYVPDMRPIGAARHSDANVKAWALRDALQSLNQDHTVDANDMIAAVKGVADE